MHQEIHQGILVFFLPRQLQRTEGWKGREMQEEGNVSYRHCTAASSDLLAHMLSSKLDCQDKRYYFWYPSTSMPGSNIIISLNSVKGIFFTSCLNYCMLCCSLLKNCYILPMTLKKKKRERENWKGGIALNEHERQF